MFLQAKHDWKMKINHAISWNCKQEIVKMSLGITWIFIGKNFFVSFQAGRFTSNSCGTHGTTAGKFDGACPKGAGAESGIKQRSGTAAVFGRWWGTIQEWLVFMFDFATTL
jgi:hypothetical protein